MSANRRFLAPVTTHSIRYRILKGLLQAARHLGRAVTTHSIRYRILKGWTVSVTGAGCGWLQPIRSDTGY